MEEPQPQLNPNINGEFTILVKLVDGDTYIGQLSEETEQSITLNNPMKLYLQNYEGTPTSILVPWSPFTEQDFVVLDKLHILWIADPKPGILKFYSKQFSENFPADSIQTESLNDDDIDPEVLRAWAEKLSSNNTIQ